MKKSLQETSAYILAREQATRLQNELARLDNEIEAHDASAKAAIELRGNSRLRAGLAVLDGDISSQSEKRAALCAARDAVAAAITPAHREIEAAIREQSREYYKGQSTKVLTALDGLVAALDGVMAACAPFQIIRDAGEKMGYDSDATSLPISIDKTYTEMVGNVLPELRKDADRLRDSLDASLDSGSIQVRALMDLPAHAIEIGKFGAVPTRQARTLIRDGQAEEADPRQRLRELI